MTKTKEHGGRIYTQEQAGHTVMTMIYNPLAWKEEMRNCESNLSQFTLLVTDAHFPTLLHTKFIHTYKEDILRASAN